VKWKEKIQKKTGNSEFKWAKKVGFPPFFAGNPAFFAGFLRDSGILVGKKAGFPAFLRDIFARFPLFPCKIFLD
jgi:hypothetical protein